MSQNPVKVEGGKGMIKISASLLSCNTAYLGETVLALEKAGVDAIHLDIMDGHYVENFAFSPKNVEDLREITPLLLEVHLEIFEPERYIPLFAQKGADLIILQWETCHHPLRALQKIHEYGKKAGVALSPTSDITPLEYCAPYLDYLLLMSVEPGFGGQRFEPSVIAKVKRAREIFSLLGCSIPIGVDGGVSAENLPLLQAAGVEVAVIGTQLFIHGDTAKMVEELKKL